LLTTICRRKDVNRDWLFARCREVEADPNGRLDLWAREHYKSFIITFGLTLQDILASHGEDPEPRYGGREVTVGIFSYNRPEAKKPLRQIKQECENNNRAAGALPRRAVGGEHQAGAEVVRRRRADLPAQDQSEGSDRRGPRPGRRPADRLAFLHLRLSTTW
jgi:hypothetical protein